MIEKYALGIHLWKMSELISIHFRLKDPVCNCLCSDITGATYSAKISTTMRTSFLGIIVWMPHLRVHILEENWKVEDVSDEELRKRCNDILRRLE